MRAPIIAFFNNKGGVGKTSLVYHLAWMFSDLNVTVLAADLDPQANLTAAVIGEDAIETMWTTGIETVYSTVEPLIEGTGDVRSHQPWEVTRNFSLIEGDLRLSNFEDILATGWGECLAKRPRGFTVSSAFWKILTKTAAQISADITLIDLGPNLGAINRAALLAADYLVVPLAADLFSLQGMKNLGPTVKRWKAEWHGIRNAAPPDSPDGSIRAIGYVVQQHSVRLDRPVKSYDKWIARIPAEFRSSLLDEQFQSGTPSVKEDPWCLALLKHYHSLMPMAQEAHKPMFHLTAADGAIGAHYNAAKSSGQDFRRLAKRIAEGAGLHLPQLKQISV